MRKPTPFQVLYIIAAVSVFALLALWLWSGKDLYTFVTDQGDIIGTLLTGIGGFWGVICTLKRNADHTLAQQKLDHEHQARVLRRALSAELSAMHRDLTHQQSSLEQTEKQYGDKMPSPRPHSGESRSIIYRTMSDKLGLLEPSQAEAVVVAYSEFAELCELSVWCNDTQMQFVKAGQPITSIYTAYRKALGVTLFRVDAAVKALA